MAIYEVTYSTKTASDDELSFSDIVLVEADEREELVAKVVNIIHKLGPPGSYYVDSIGGNPYETVSKRRISKKVAKDWDNLLGTINARLEAHPNREG